VTFYDDVLRELLVAVGGALFVGNLLALVRRRRPVPDDAPEDLERAPASRTVLYMVVGLVVMVWGIASLLAA
jgi:hypothetical protein